MERMRRGEHSPYQSLVSPFRSRPRSAAIRAPRGMIARLVPQSAE